MKKSVLSLLTLTTLLGAAMAAPQTFDFKDPKGVNNAIFKLDAPLEAINGSATGISGTVSYDPAKPDATKGKIVIASSSLHVGNPMMKEHLQSEQWMDVKKFPEITYDVSELKSVKTEGNVTTAEAVGKFTVHGITKELTVPIKLTYLKDKLAQRVPNLKGDLLVVRSNFTLKRSDFGIMPGKMEEKVSDTIELTLSIAGASKQ